MANVMRVLRSTTAAARPVGRAFGELWWNEADSAFGIITSNGTTAEIPYLRNGGGTLSGDLNIQRLGGAWPSLKITGDSGSRRQIVMNSFVAGESPRFALQTDNVAESGGNAGSDFNILRYDDTGAWLGTALSINRATGATTIPGLVLGIDDLDDVDTSTTPPTDGQVLSWSAAGSEWVPADGGGGGGGDADPMWGLAVWNDNTDFSGWTGWVGVATLKTRNLSVAGEAINRAGDETGNTVESRVTVQALTGHSGPYTAFFGGACCQNRQNTGVCRSIISLKWEGDGNAIGGGPKGASSLEVSGDRFIGAMGSRGGPGSARNGENHVWVQSTNENCQISGVRVEWGVFDVPSGALLAGSGDHTITRNAVGEYSIGLANPMTDANYGIIIQGHDHNCNMGQATMVTSATFTGPPINKTVNGFDCHSSNRSGASTPADRSAIAFMCVENGPAIPGAQFRGEWAVYDKIGDSLIAGTPGLSVAAAGAAANDFTVTFGTPMQDAGYVVLATACREAGNASQSIQMTGGQNTGEPEEKTATTVQMRRVACGSQNAGESEWNSMLFIEPI